MREGLNRVWIALVTIAFCLPLFVGLGNTDLGNDEAIYSYAVDSILETGEWLSPRSSPNAHITFLEKPPLKFWIVAAPIRLGLLPRSEVGLRFWDAMFGAVAFLYVFFTGARLAGPLCGAFAVLVLFAHPPLLFDHGLRSNNMEAALLLSYCGGVYHFLRWADSTSARQANGHIAAVAGFFYLGFMTKFVAALFLPVVVAAAATALPACRARLRRDWLRWAAAAGAFLVLAAPWFLYQYLRNGRQVWMIMFGEHVYTRFTAYVDPLHVRPWHYYFSQMFVELHHAGAAWWVAAGLLLMAVRALRTRETVAIVLLLWAVVPASLISLGSSKIYHYVYPFIPPMALAGGYAVAWFWRQAVRMAQPLSARASAFDAWRAPRRPLRIAALAVFALAVLVAAATALEGPLRVELPGGLVLKNTRVERPLVVAAVCLLLLLEVGGLAAGAAVALVVALVPTPVGKYAQNLAQLRVERQPLSLLADCLRDVDRGRRRRGEAAAGVYAPVSHAAFHHPYFYYLRGNGWHREVIDEVLADALFVPGRERPVAIDPQRYTDFVQRNPGRREPLTVRIERILVALPGPYEMCVATQGGVKP